MTLPAQTVHLPFEAGPYRMAMGLIAQHPDDLAEIDDQYPAELAERRRLLDTERAAVFDAVPGSEAACAETLARLSDVLPRRFPDWFTKDGAVLHNRLTGEAWNIEHPSLHPLEIAGRLTQEDWCIVQLGADSPILTAAVLCFPSRWVLAQKIGRPLAAVHGPVPLYAERLANPVDRFMAQVKPGKLVQRLNWSLLDDPTLFQPVRRFRDGPDPTYTAENVPDLIFLRVERQTLSALPASNAVLFGIRVHVYKLRCIAERPEIAARLAAAVRAIPDEVKRHKTFPAYEAAVLAYLDRRAESMNTATAT